MSKKHEEQGTVDIDYADQAVPKEGRKGFLTMFMIMLGFTFFLQVCGLGSRWQQDLISGDLSSPSSWVVRSLVFTQDFLGYVGAKTGLKHGPSFQESVWRERFLYFISHDQFHTPDRMVWSRSCNVCNPGST